MKEVKKEARTIPNAVDPREEFFQALASSRRLEIVSMLKDGPKSASQIVPALKIDQSAVSRHLSLLRKAGIIESWKEGVNVYYRIADERVYEILDLAAQILRAKNEELLKRLSA